MRFQPATSKGSATGSPSLLATDRKHQSQLTTPQHLKLLELHFILFTSSVESCRGITKCRLSIEASANGLCQLAARSLYSKRLRGRITTSASVCHPYLVVSHVVLRQSILLARIHISDTARLLSSASRLMAFLLLLPNILRIRCCLPLFWFFRVWNSLASQCAVYSTWRLTDVRPASTSPGIDDGITVVQGLRNLLQCLTLSHKHHRSRWGCSPRVTIGSCKTPI